MLKLRSRFNAVRFEFQLHIHSLQPWPATTRPLAIGWQRGRRRRGATASVLPLPAGAAPGGGSLVRFNERVRFKATLYKVMRAGDAKQRAAGTGKHTAGARMRA
jgi:hypothetical protein